MSCPIGTTTLNCKNTNAWVDMIIEQYASNHGHQKNKRSPYITIAPTAYRMPRDWIYSVNFIRIKLPQLKDMGDTALFGYFTENMMSSNGNIFRVTGTLWGEPPVTGGFPSQRPVTRSVDIFFDQRLPYVHVLYFCLYPCTRFFHIRNLDSVYCLNIITIIGRD